MNFLELTSTRYTKLKFLRTVANKNVKNTLKMLPCQCRKNTCDNYNFSVQYSVILATCGTTIRKEKIQNKVILVTDKQQNNNPYNTTGKNNMSTTL